MNIYRLTAWKGTGKEVFATDEASRLITQKPCIVNTYDLLGSDGGTAKISVFPSEKPALFIIEPQSPKWAEDAVRRLFNHDGSKNEKWRAEA